MKLLFATGNRGKLDELEALVQGLALELHSLRDLEPLPVAEDGATLEENAGKKALAYARRYGWPALADDSGLFVDALGGAPGVHSARFAASSGAPLPATEAERHERNNRLLLERLSGKGLEERGAEFRCVLCLAVPGREPLFVRGTCRGRIALAPRGKHGFGYDPVFEIPALGQTLAEMSATEKNQLSHRARAFQALRPYLQKLAAGLDA